MRKYTAIFTGFIGLWLGVSLGTASVDDIAMAPSPPPIEVIAETATPAPTPTPPAPTPTPQATATPLPTAVHVEIPTGDAGCLLAPPSTLDEVETAFWLAFENRFCEGDEAVRVIGCEGWNASANYDPTFISRTDDVGPAQINWVHGKPGGLIAGQWPTYVQTIEGNIDVALRLRQRSGNWYDWKNSRHCHGVQ